MADELKPGDRVKFNLGAATGPEVGGVVTRKFGQGVIIAPDRPVPMGTVFHNIKKVDR